MSIETDNAAQNPHQRKVFISYSRTSPEHEDKVLVLANALVGDGINVVIDKWDLKEGQDLYHFMEQMVTDPTYNRVLCICDRRYTDKANRREDGVGIEALIITPVLYESVGATKEIKFVPVIFEHDEEGRAYRPVFLKTKFYIDLANQDFYDENYETLVRNIFDKPALKKPPLGVPPSYITDEDKITSHTSVKLRRLKEALRNSKPSVRGDLRDYLREFKSLLPTLTFREDEQSVVEQDDLVLKKIDDFEPFRQEFFELVSILCDYGSKEHFEALLDVFDEAISEMYSYGKYPSIHAFWKIEALVYVSRDLFLNSCAILVKASQWEEFDVLCDHVFQFDRTGNGLTQQGYDILEPSYFKTLDEYRNKRLSLNRNSVIADMIKDRCTIPGIDFETVQQTDVILALRAALNFHGRWFPRTMALTYHFTQKALPIFAKAIDSKRFEVVKRILKIESKADFLSKFKEANKVLHLENWGWTFDRVQWFKLVNLENLPES